MWYIVSIYLHYTQYIRDSQSIEYGRIGSSRGASYDQLQALLSDPVSQKHYRIPAYLQLWFFCQHPASDEARPEYYAQNIGHTLLHFRMWYCRYYLLSSWRSISTSWQNLWSLVCYDKSVFLTTPAEGIALCIPWRAAYRAPCNISRNIHLFTPLTEILGYVGFKVLYYYMALYFTIRLLDISFDYRVLEDVKGYGFWLRADFTDRLSQLYRVRPWHSNQPSNKPFPSLNYTFLQIYSLSLFRVLWTEFYNEITKCKASYLVSEQVP